MLDTPKWIYVTKRFSAFLSNIALTQAQVDDGLTKARGVVSCLNSAYYGNNSESDNAFLIGSWGKGTHIRPPRDVDVYFLLPADVYHRFEQYTSNKQSALLQEVKGHLLKTYPSSNIKGDGPVVLASFLSYSVEIVPAFALQEQGSYWVCDTKNGGSYITTKPLDEANSIEMADKRNAQNVRPLIRMMKVWQAWCNVPLKSFCLELLAIEYMDKCAWRLNGVFYYDWICRDFFEFLVSKANGFVIAPGTYKVLWLGSDWKTRAESAHLRAIKACEYERNNEMISAGDEWQKIFGADIPRIV